MNQVQQPATCGYCGCVLRFRAVRDKKSLATSEQRREVTREFLATRDGEAYRARMAAIGYVEVWTLSRECPGCGRRTAGGPSYAQAAAEALAAVQNQAAETPEALHVAVHWREEVRRRSEQDARAFRTLLLAGHPDWEPYMVPIPGPIPGEERKEPRWDCALLVRVPSPNPSVEHPLQAQVLGGEVFLTWIAPWHVHIGFAERWPDPEHLREAAELLEGIVTERTAIVLYCRGESVIAGGQMAAGGALPHWSTVDIEQPDGGEERIVVRSWRGTYDRVVEPKATPPPPLPGPR